MVFSEKLEKLLQSFKQMDVDRKLREELRMDSQRLHEEFREEYRKRQKRPYGESHPYNAFIPKRFEDLKLNGGTRFRRIPIKLNYHRSRFKKLKSKSPRRTLDSKGLLYRTGLATFQRRCVGMKKQYHQKKRTAQVKLAQACKSLGMFLVSPSFRDPKDCTKICVVKRQIIDTGVRPETHLFWYEFTSQEPTSIDGHIDTRIGDQSIFAEDVTALDHDDPDAAMEPLKDETVMELEEPSKYKSSEERSHSGRHWFHKVRFKVRLARRSKVAAEKVTKCREPFKFGNSKLLHTRRSKYTRGLTVIWYYYKVRQRREHNIGCDAQSEHELQHGINEDSTSVKGTRRGTESGRRNPWKKKKRHKKLKKILEKQWGNKAEKGPWYGFRRDYVVGEILEAARVPGRLRNETAKAILTAEGEQLDHKGNEIWSSAKTVGENRPSKFCLASQVWEPGGDSDKRVQFMKKPPEPLWRFVVDSSQYLSLLFVKWKEVPGCEGSKETKAKRWLKCYEEFDPSRKLYVWDPGQNETAKRSLELRKNTTGPKSDDTSDFYVQTQHYEFRNNLSLKTRKGVDSYCEDGGAGSQNPNVDGNYVWNPGAVEVEEDKSCSSVIAEKLWNAEYRRLSVMHVQTNSENEVKWVVVLSVTRSLEGQKSFSSYEDVITVPAFGIWSLEDKAVILPGRTLKLYGEKTAKLFLSAEKRIIEEAADCHEVNSQDLENVLMTFILASHYLSGVDQNLMRDSTQDSQAVLTQFHWSWYWILVVHNVLLCLHVSALCYHMFHLPRSPEFSLFEKVTGQELEEDNKTQDPVTLPPVSDAHDIDGNIQWHATCGDVSQVPKLKLNSQGSLSKEGRVSYVYSNSGMSDALLNHQVVTPTSEKLQGREEMMEFCSYDWFQSPRPPELSKTRNLVSLLYTSALGQG